MRGLIIIVIAVFSIPAFGQFGSKATSSKGTMFAYWGYNRTIYSQSDINFAGTGYDFTMEGVEASDNPAPFSIEGYFALDKITVPQFNIRFGYYYKDGWSLSVGYDHFKYVINDRNSVNLYGVIQDDVDETTNLSGTYTGEEFTTDRNTFHYENSNGMNYIRVALDRSLRLIKSSNRNKFGLTAMLGVSTGAIYSVNDFNFAGQHDRYTPSVSGIGVSLHSGLRFEFFDHLFLQPNLNAGYINQFAVKTRSQGDINALAKQRLSYGEFNVVIGWLFRNKKGKNCDCPTW